MECYEGEVRSWRVEKGVNGHGMVGGASILFALQGVHAAMALCEEACVAEGRRIKCMAMVLLWIDLYGADPAIF